MADKHYTHIIADADCYDTFGVPTGQPYLDYSKMPWFETPPSNGHHVPYPVKLSEDENIKFRDNCFAITGLVYGEPAQQDPMAVVATVASPPNREALSPASIEPERPLPDYVYLDFGGVAPGQSCK